MKRSIEELGAAHAVTDWAGASFEERSKALWDLLELVDALPVHGEDPIARLLRRATINGGHRHQRLRLD